MAGKTATSRTGRGRSVVMAEAAERLQAQQSRCRDFLRDYQQRLSALEQSWQQRVESLVRQLSAWQPYETQAAAKHAELQRTAALLDGDRDAFSQQQIELQQRSQELERRTQATEIQRQRIAKSLDERRRKLLVDQANGRAELEAQLLEAQDALRDWEDRQKQWELERQQSASTAKIQASDLEALRAEHRTIQSQSARWEQEAGQLRLESEALRAEIARQAAAPQVDSQQLDNLQSDLNRWQTLYHDLQSRCEELERECQSSRVELAAVEAKRSAESSNMVADEEVNKELETLRSELEMAHESVAALRSKNDRLEEQLEQLTAAGTNSSNRESQVAAEPADEDAGPLDWEAQKRRLMAMLDDEQVSGDDYARIEETIRQTDRILQEREAEVHELRRQLQVVVATNDSEARGRQAESDLVLDADAVVRAERERLVQMQAELQKKLCAAEVEISQERAQNARMRAELEEKLRDVDSELARVKPPNDRSGKAKPSGRRWLDHLGLGKDEDKGT